jgi:hypothetical protein
MLAAAIVLVGQAQGGVVTFDATGSFLGGGTLGGTLTIDVTAGVVTASDLTVSAPISLTFAFIQIQSQCCVFNDYQIQVGASTGVPNGVPYLALLLPTTTLIGYAGGEIGSIDQPANGFSSGIQFLSGEALLDVGSLTAAAVPEPATSLLMASVFGILATIYGVANRRSLRSFHMKRRPEN